MRLLLDQKRLNADVRNTASALRRFSTISQADIADLTKQSARRTAANFAFRTQPFGNSAKAHAVGMIAVRRDILRVYATPGMLFEQVEGAAPEPQTAKYFYALCKRGEWSKVRTLLRTLGIDIDVRQTPNAQHHRRARNGRGRVMEGTAPLQLVGGGKNGDSLERYITKIQKRVGYAASGWSAAAAQLGNTRGIPKWKKRGRRGPGHALTSGGDKRPTIYLINTCDYISVVLPLREVSKALRREEATLRQMAEITLKKTARKTGFKVS
jgi:hypothetical protein